MKLVSFKAVTPGYRFKKVLLKKKLLSSFSVGLNRLYRFKKSSGGRNFSGRTTVFKRGRLIKQRYRFLDFNRFLFSVFIGSVFDSNRSNFLSLFISFLFYKDERVWDSVYFHLDGQVLPNFSLLIAYSPFFDNFNKTEMKYFFSGFSTFLVRGGIGSLAPLIKIPLGLKISNCELVSGFGAQLIRSAGCFGVILKKTVDRRYVFIELPSGVVYKVLGRCSAMVGRSGNLLYNKIVLGKAGSSRLLGFKSTVRGIAMNPVDHPHGGRTNGGRPSVSPWGKLAK